MTQQTQTNSSPLKTVLFDIIIAESKKIASELASSIAIADGKIDLIDIETLDLPTGGARRGEELAAVINEAGSQDLRPVLFVRTEATWLQPLFTAGHSMARAVWTGVKNKLLGHHTDRNRGAIYVAVSLGEDGVEYIDIAPGEEVPANWRAPKPEPKSSTPKSDTTALNQNQTKAPTTKPNKMNQQEKSKPQNNKPKPQQERNNRHRGPRKNTLSEDLTLAAKGHYGQLTDETDGVIVLAIMGYHTEKKFSTIKDINAALLDALLLNAPRTIWSNRELVRKVVAGGSDGPNKMADVLFAELGNLPMVDGEWSLKLPEPNKQLLEIVQREINPKDCAAESP